jgi:hypothetical protein
MSLALILGRNGLVLRDDDFGRDGRVLVFPLGAGKSQNLIDLGDIESSVLGETNTTGSFFGIESANSETSFATPEAASTVTE